MKMMTAFCACLAIAGAAPALAKQDSQRGEAALAKALEGRTAGKPVNCITTNLMNGVRIIDGTAIVYDDGRTLYVNRPESGASSLDSNTILVTHQIGSQLCSIDIVRLVDSGSRMSRGSVSLGEFVPYTRVKG